MIFEKIYDKDNLQEAWARVRGGKSPPGIDRISCEDFAVNLSANLHTIQKQIREESYRPLPVMVFDKKKAKGKSRTIGISSVRDKVVQQAILRVIGPHFEKNFLPCSCAYRPGKSALSAVQKAVRLVKSGNLWAMQMDVVQFFDTMNHSILLELIRQVLNEKPLIRLVSRLLKAKIFKEMGLFDSMVGSRQGSGLSPLLSNIYMHPIDLYLWKKYGENYLRYSDDIVLFSREKGTLDEARQLIERCLQEMKLTSNADKTVVKHLSDGIVYLGYHIDSKGQGPDKKSVLQLQRRLDGFDKVRKNDNIQDKISEISVVIKGWYNYYKTLKPVNPPNILSLIALVRLAREFGEPKIAGELLRRSGDFTHAHPQIAYELGELFSAMGMESQAMREYARTLELDPSKEEARQKVRTLQEGETDIYSAIEKIQLVLHHNPAYREGYRKLAEYYSELGLYGFAQKAHEKALEIDDDHREDPPMPVSELPADRPDDFDYRSVDQELFLSVFSGRKDAHAKQWIDERGRWGFMRVERPLKKKDIFKHLKGEVTLAVYPVSEADTVNFIVFDVDTAKRKILESDAASIEVFRIETHENILRIKTVCDQMGLKLYIEDSGYKGRHGWLFFAEPVPAPVALKLGQEIMKKAGGPSDGMVWELFPMGRSERHKSIIKLPMGLNRKNNRRCLFLTDAGEAIEDQALFLRTMRRNDIGHLGQMMSKDRRPPVEAVAVEDPVGAAPDGLRRMVEGCLVLRYLISKAKDTNYLNHYERLCLLYTLTFAGEEGKEYLHRVIGYCVNYDRQYTGLQIERRKESPISCARIGEYFPELVESLKCNCIFEHRPTGSYPSPVLYLLEAEIEQAYPAVRNVAAEKAEGETVAEADTDSEAPCDEVPILDFERLFASGVEGGESEGPDDGDIPETGQSETAEASPCNAEQYEDGKMETAMLSEPSRLDALEKLEVVSDDAEELHGGTLDTWKLAVRLMRLRHTREVIGREIEAVGKRMEEIFDGQSTDYLKTPVGIIRREKGKDGESVWVLKS